MDLKVLRKRLDNGISLVILPLRRCGLVRTQMFVKCGWICETDKTWEMAHTMEHMLGGFPSDRYPSSKKNQLMLETLGAVVNAYTSPDETSYYIQGLSKHQEVFIDIMCRAFTHFQVDYDVIRQENLSVINELERFRDSNPWYESYEAVRKELFKETNYYKRSVEHRIENVANITPEALLEFYHSHYLNHRTFFVVAGDIDVNHTFHELSKRLKDHTTKSKHTGPETLRLHYSQGPKVLFSKHSEGSMSRIDVLFSHKITPFHVAEDAVISMIHVILTGGLSSRLHMKLRSELGIVYNVSSITSLETLESPFEAIRTVVSSSEKIPLYLQSLMNELRKLHTERLSDDELKKIKNTVSRTFLSRNLNRSLESYVDMYMEPVLRNKPIVTLKQRFEILKNVSAEDVMTVAKKIYRRETLIIGISTQTELTTAEKLAIRNSL